MNYFDPKVILSSIVAILAAGALLRFLHDNDATKDISTYVTSGYGSFGL